MQLLNRQYYKLGIITLCTLSATIVNPIAFAQLIPDPTLGTENSIVNQIDSSTSQIEGGAIRGINLFHSFQEFNIGENQSIYFANPVNVENILTRVTGNNASHILGKLGVAGTANLFLINPNGIFFGNGTTLDIHGSLNITTADSIKLGDNGLFSATNPQNSNLLSVQPGALFINALKNQQAEINNAGNLKVDPGQNINLFAANITNTGTLTAAEGIVKLTGTEYLKVRGNINTTTLLLDTKNLTIAENDNSTIKQNTLENLSGNTNLIFQATNDITINSLINKTLNLAHGSGKITFIADADNNSIGNFQMDITDTIKTNNRDISISGASLNLGNIDTSAPVLMTGGDIISVVDIDAGGAIPNSGTKGTATFTFTVPNLGQNISNLALQFSAAHTYDNDLKASLTSPSGTTLGLFNSVGNIGDNFQDTLLDDDALVSIHNALPPFSGKFKPTNVKGFASFNGENSTGIWQLKVTDNYEEDSGTLYKAGETAPWGIADGTKLIFRTPINIISPSGDSGAITLNAKSGNINVGNIYSANLRDSGGEVNIQSTGNINLNGSINASGGINGSSGNITLNSNHGQISLSNVSIVSDNYGLNKGGDINISAKSVFISNGSLLSANTLGAGNAGMIKILANDAVKFDGESFAASRVLEGSPGIAGGVNISTSNLQLLNGSFISADTFGTGDAGGVNISTQSLQLLNGSFISADTFGKGDAGGVNIFTQSLELMGASFLSADTLDQGNAGTVKIIATDFIRFDSESFAASRVLEGSVGKAGGVDISTPFLELLNSSFLAANTETDSTGDSGNITIDSSTLIIKNGAGIGVNSQGSGNGGNIFIKAGTLNLDNQAFINAATASSQGGEITLEIKDLLFMRHDSKITATAGNAGGNGGNINIYAPFIIAFPNENNDITADAFAGQGGNIKITTNALFGIKFRSQLTPKSDITASSEFGVNGNVEIKTPGVYTPGELVKLADDLVDAESLVSSSICAEERIAQDSSFIIVGKGGLPANTEDLIANSPGLVEWLNPKEPLDNREIEIDYSLKNNNQDSKIKSQIIQQAQGWIISADGKVILTAEPLKVTPQSSNVNHPNCHISGKNTHPS